MAAGDWFEVVAGEEACGVPWWLRELAVVTPSPWARSVEAADHHSPTGAGDPDELADHRAGVGSELAHRHRDRDMEAGVVEREPVDIALDQFTGHAAPGEHERRRVRVDAHDARTFGLEPGSEPPGAAAGVTHLQPCDGSDGIEEQVMLDAAGVATPWPIEPCVVCGGVCTPV